GGNRANPDLKEYRGRLTRYEGRAASIRVAALIGGGARARCADLAGQSGATAQPADFSRQDSRRPVATGAARAVEGAERQRRADVPRRCQRAAEIRRTARQDQVRYSRSTGCRRHLRLRPVSTAV